MKKTILISLTLCMSWLPLCAQLNSEVEQLRQQVQAVKEAFDKAQAESRRQIDELTRKLDTVLRAQSNTASQLAAPTQAKPALPPEQRKLEEELALEMAEGKGPTNSLTQPPLAPVKSWSPSDPIKVFGGQQSYMNLSFDALFAVGSSSTKDVEALEFGGHDPKQRGFTVQNLELTLDGKVDHYFRGQANIVLQIDPNGETTIEAEEAYLESLALPWNLQVKGGQYYAPFGRINSQHPHAWDFVDQPLVAGRFLGPDGLRNPGAQISWLAPTPFYSELYFSVQNSQGETAFSFRDAEGAEAIAQRPAVDTSVNNLGDMLYTPRYAMSFDLSDEHTIVLGGSAAIGPNASGQNTDTLIYGADLFYKWKPRNQSKGFPFVTWQTEFMFSRYQAGAFAGGAVTPALPAETLHNWGFYSQVSYGFRPGWVGSLRGEYVTGEPGNFFENPVTDTRYRISPALTWFPSEFSKIRLQYNYDHIQNTGMENSIWLQFEFLLGAHSAHNF